MFRSRSCYCILCSLIGVYVAWLLLGATPQAAEGQPPKGPVSFINDVAPILRENCFACHDAKKRKGKFEMTSYENFRKGGTKDDPIVPGKPNESILIDVLKSTGKDRMPPAEIGHLAKDKIAVIAKWIEEGAKLDAGLDAKADLARELRLRFKPPSPLLAYSLPEKVTALAFTPDNKKLVAGGYHELTIWDAEQAKLEKRISTRLQRVLSLVFLPDGKLVAAGGRPGQEGKVFVYDINAGGGKNVNGVVMLDGVNDKAVLLKELIDSDDEVIALALSPDGKKLASGGCDRLVRVWDISGGIQSAKLEHSIENHADWVFGVAFSPDGKHLGTASRDKTAKVWDLAAKESLLTFPDHQKDVYGVGFTPDGKTGFSVGHDNNVRYWQATDEKKQIGKQVRTSGGHTKEIVKVAYHADPKNPLIATCSADMSVRLWNPVTGAALKTLGGHSDWVYSVAISPNGQLIAGGAWNGEVRIWKVSDGNLAKSFNASPGYVAPKTAEAAKK
jgi:mono/diheme cytochrome c family protein